MARVIDSIADSSPSLSYEFFPPKSVAATDALLKQITLLEDSNPDFVSVTYGAGGTTRNRTASLVCGLSATRNYPVMPHLTAAGHTLAEVKEISHAYADAGVENMLVLGGDPPRKPSQAACDYRYATDLLADVQSLQDFCVGVAAFPEIHPRSSSRRMDRVHLADKLESADFGITQFFFHADRWCEMMGELTVLGSSTPVIAGVLPVTNPDSARRFAAMNGTAVDEELFSRLESADSDEEREDIAVEHAVGLVNDLIEAGAPGIHLYTLNQARPSLRVVAASRLGESRAGV